MLARWRRGDGAVLAIACNLGPRPAACAVAGKTLFEGTAGAAASLAAGSLPARCTVALIEPTVPAATGRVDGPMLKGPG